MLKHLKNISIILYYALHIAPVIILFILTFTDVLYNYNEPVMRQDYTLAVKALSFITLLVINIILKIIRKIKYMPEKKHVLSRVIVLYLGLSTFSYFCVPRYNKLMKFYSPDKTNTIMLEESSVARAKCIKVRASERDVFSLCLEPPCLVYNDNSYKVYSQFKWINESNLYFKFSLCYSPCEERIKYYKLINLKKSEEISKEEYQKLNTHEYTFMT